jgi:hypothetical protein
MAKQPTYPHNIKYNYVWWAERGRIGIAYHDTDDGNDGRNLEFISPHEGYTAKLTSNTIGFGDGTGTQTISCAVNSGNATITPASASDISKIRVGAGVTDSGSLIGSTTVESVGSTTFTIASSAAATGTGTGNLIFTEDIITDSSGNFLNAGFAVGDEINITGSGTAGNNVTVTIGAITASQINVVPGTLGATVTAGADTVTIGAGTSVKARLFVTKKAEVADGGKFVVTDLDDYPEFPEQFHESLVYYIVAKGYEKKPVKEMLELAGYWWQRYLTGVSEARAFADTNQVGGPRIATTNSVTGIL